MSTLKSDTIQSVGSNLVFANSAATETMRILSTGNVGIGTNAPTSLLHVAGTALITGAASLSSTLNVSGLATLAGATSSAIISCGTAPTLGQHLANKTYVDGQAIGVGQTWQDVTASRALGTIAVPGTGYLNSTGRTIMANVTCAHSTTGQNNQVRASVSSDGTNYVVVADSNDDGARRHTQSFLIPNGHRYRCHIASGTPTLHSWVELR